MIQFDIKRKFLSIKKRRRFRLKTATRYPSRRKNENTKPHDKNARKRQ